MNNYRSAYEYYYKNINNKSKEKKDNNKYLPLSMIHKGGTKFQYGANKNSEPTFKELIIRRIIRELIGATIVLFIFFGLKYIPSDQIQKLHITCEQGLNEQFNYDESIDAFSTMQIGNFKAKDLKIGNYTLEDIKFQNLKTHTSNFIQYLKNSSKLQVQPDNE